MTQLLAQRRTRRSLVNACQRHTREFGKLPGMQDLSTSEGHLFFLDRGAPILGVAHLDSVLTSKPQLVDYRIQCPQLDDRLGAWLLLQALPDMECPPFDVLLTDNEERGKSTGASFTAPRQYHWMFQFDRSGDDVVCYDYEDDALTERLEQAGFDVGWGTFSDICRMEHLNCKGINFGTGYHRAHTKECYADLHHTLASAAHFVDFAQQYHDTPMPHTPGLAQKWTTRSWPDNIVRDRPYYWQQPVHRGRVAPARYSSSYESCETCRTCQEPIEYRWVYCPWCGDELHRYV